MTKPDPLPEATASSPSKLNQVLAAVRARSGASLSELVELTGWQPHSVRAVLTRLRHRGHAIERTQTRAGTRYRLVRSR